LQLNSYLLYPAVHLMIFSRKLCEMLGPFSQTFTRVNRNGLRTNWQKFSHQIVTCRYVTWENCSTR